MLSLDLLHLLVARQLSTQEGRTCSSLSWAPTAQVAMPACKHRVCALASCLKHSCTAQWSDTSITNAPQAV